MPSIATASRELRVPQGALRLGLRRAAPIGVVVLKDRTLAPSRGYSWKKLAAPLAGK